MIKPFHNNRQYYWFGKKYKKIVSHRHGKGQFIISCCNIYTQNLNDMFPGYYSWLLDIISWLLYNHETVPLCIPFQLLGELYRLRVYPNLKTGTMTNTIEWSSCHVATITRKIQMIGFYYWIFHNFTTMRPFHDVGHLNWLGGYIESDCFHISKLEQ